MSTAPSQPSATIDDLAREREAGRAVELVDSEIVPKAMPSPKHDSVLGEGGPKQAVYSGYPPRPS